MSAKREPFGAINRSVASVPSIGEKNGGRTYASVSLLWWKSEVYADVEILSRSLSRESAYASREKTSLLEEMEHVQSAQNPTIGSPNSNSVSPVTTKDLMPLKYSTLKLQLATAIATIPTE